MQTTYFVSTLSLCPESAVQMQQFYFY